MPLIASSQVVRELPEDRIQIPGMTQLDGQYIILVTNPKAVGQSQSSCGVPGCWERADVYQRPML
jgi:hypothetical protein